MADLATMSQLDQGGSSFVFRRELRDRPLRSSRGLSILVWSVLQKNLEILQSSIEALDRRDREAWLKLNDRDAEFRADPEWPEAEIVRGREAVWDMVISIVDAWERIPSNIVEVIDAGHDRLVVRFSQPVRGKASGIETEFGYSLVATFRRGKLFSSWWFADHAKALQAAGLSDLSRRSAVRRPDGPAS